MLRQKQIIQWQYLLAISLTCRVNAYKPSHACSCYKQLCNLSLPKLNVQQMAICYDKSKLFNGNIC